MRLGNLAGRAVVLDGTTAVDVAEASQGAFGPDPAAVYEQWDTFRAWAAGALPDARSGAEPAVRPAGLGCPSPMPRQVFGVGLNYRSHAEETGTAVPEVPAVFTKFPTCLDGPESVVALPGPTVDWEVELVVVVGRRAERVPEADGWSHVAGLCVGQDLSERTVQFAAGVQFSLGKSFPGFGPMGPWLVTPDEFEDPDDLALGCRVNGETVQDDRTSGLVYGVPALMARLSAVVPLLPGDVIFTGTPAGVGQGRTPPRFLAPGDVLESWVEGIGTIRTTCVGTSAGPPST
jgi:2,4-didehydro-3-deoxy-L-rhamnonate hydrolase